MLTLRQNSSRIRTHANSTLSFRKTTLHTTQARIRLHTQSLGSHKLLRRLHLTFLTAFGIEHVGGRGVRAKPPHHKSHAISCCAECFQCLRCEERLVAEEQVVHWAEDEEGPVPTRHGEQGVHDICGPVTCFTTARWECQLQHHGCVAHGEDEYIAVCKLRVPCLLRIPCHYLCYLEPGHGRLILMS